MTRIVADTMSVDQERAVWDRVEKQRMAVDRTRERAPLGSLAMRWRMTRTVARCAG